MAYVAIDVETANGFMGSICQIGAVKFVDGVEVAALDYLVDPRDEFWAINTSIHGITSDMVRGQPTFSELLPELTDFVGQDLAVCHTHFDRVSISQACNASGVVPVNWQWLDSTRVARRAWAEVSKSGYGLADLANRFGIQFRHHNACEDARVAGLILQQAIEDTGIALTDWLPVLASRKRLDGKEADRINLAAIDGGPLSNEVICFTGQLSMTRSEAAGTANQLGAAIEAGVTKRTTILVVGDQDLSKLAGHEKSSKHRKAEKMVSEGASIRILAERDFLSFRQFG